MQTDSTMSPMLEQLVGAIHTVLDEHTKPEQIAASVAAVLRPFLGQADLLRCDQCEADPTQYRQHVLYVAEGGVFSVVALVWLPGQATAIHDHVSWCVVGVHQGQEHEIRYRLIDDGPTPYLTPCATGTNAVGCVEALTPPGDIHQVVNPGPQLAISLHVYGADIGKLGSSIQNRYEYEIIPADLALAGR